MEALPLELRVYSLGLSAHIPDRPRGGRPRDLGFNQRLAIYAAFWNAVNDRARALGAHKRELIRTLAAKLARAKNEYEREQIEAEINEVAWYARDRARHPEVETAIAKEFGVTARAVRTIRSDPRLQPFKPTPAWLEPDWLREGREAFDARQEAALPIAQRLMTPERFAKGEAISIDGDTIRVLDIVARMQRRGELSSLGLAYCRDFEARIVKSGIPLARGPELEIVAGAGAPHRVGCQNIWTEGRGELPARARARLWALHGPQVLGTPFAPGPKMVLKDDNPFRFGPTADALMARSLGDGTEPEDRWDPKWDLRGTPVTRSPPRRQCGRSYVDPAAPPRHVWPPWTGVRPTPPEPVLTEVWEFYLPWLQLLPMHYLPWLHLLPMRWTDGADRRKRFAAVAVPVLMALSRWRGRDDAADAGDVAGCGQPLPMYLRAEYIPGSPGRPPDEPEQWVGYWPIGQVVTSSPLTYPAYPIRNRQCEIWAPVPAARVGADRTPVTNFHIVTDLRRHIRALILWLAAERSAERHLRLVIFGGRYLGT